MNILAIETATEACSVALSVKGEIIEDYRLAPRQHASLVLPMIERLLRRAGIERQAIDLLAVGRGPGSFTGVRIAVGVTQGLAFALDVPVVPLSTLAVLAQYHCAHRVQIAVAIDARMREVYWGLFQRDAHGLVYAVCDEMVVAPDKVSLPSNGQWFGCGSGWLQYPDVLSQGFGGSLLGFNGECFPHAAALIPLAIQAYQDGCYTDAEQVLPVYLRDKIVAS